MNEQYSSGTALQFLCMGLGRSLCVVEPRSSAEQLFATALQWADRIADAAYFACESRPVIASRQPTLAIHNGRNAGRWVETAPPRLITIYAQLLRLDIAFRRIFLRM